MATKTVQMPADLLAAIEGNGELTREQFRQLFEIEAESIGLTFDEAIAAARAGTLPRNPIGDDLRFIASILDAPSNDMATDAVWRQNSPRGKPGVPRVSQPASRSHDHCHAIDHRARSWF